MMVFSLDVWVIPEEIILPHPLQISQNLMFFVLFQSKWFVSHFQDDLNISNEQRNVDANSLDLDPYLSLKHIRSVNINRLIISQLNINSLKSKFLGVINLIKHIDILVLNETKLDEAYPKSQFL